MANKIKRYKIATTSDSGKRHTLDVEETYAVDDSSDGHLEVRVGIVISTANGDILQPAPELGKGKFRAAMSSEVFTSPQFDVS